MSTVSGFMKAKRQVIAAIDYRLENLSEGLKSLKRLGIDDNFGREQRIDELETLRTFVKGMVVKADETDQS